MGALYSGDASGIRARRVDQDFLYAFTNYPDGSAPAGTLVFDANGALYGSTSGAGTSSGGVIFKLTPRASGPWTEQIIYDGGPLNGINAPLIFDAHGDLYGTALVGGVIFKLAPPLSVVTAWTYTTLHTFSDISTCIKNSDGCAPSAGVVSDANGVFDGTTQAGGSTNNGVVFKLQCNHWSGTGKARTCLSW